MREIRALDVEEVTDLDALEGLRDEWSALCDRSPRATPFQRPEWLLPWWRAFPPEAPWVLAVRREGRLTAFAPFLIYPNEGRRTVALCGGGVSDYCDVVTDPEGEDEATAALLAYLEDHRDRWDACDFEPLPGASPLLRAPASKGWADRVKVRDVCPFLLLPDRVEDLGQVVPTRQLSNLRKYRRKATELGDLRLEEAGADTWEGMLGTVLRLHAARWSGQGQDKTFHREVARGFAARNALGLYLLCLKGRPVAGLYGFREKETFSYYMQGFDPDFARLSPGVLIVGAALEDAIRRGARVFDFLRGRETYKTWWGTTDRKTFRRTFNPPRNSPIPGA